MNIHVLRRRVAARAVGFFFGKPRTACIQTEPLPVKGVFRVLVCRITHSLGNTLLLTPLIREIEAVYPGAEIDILTRNAAATEIFGAFRSVRMVYLLPAHAFRHPWQFLQVLRSMRSVQYDLVIDPCPRSQTGRLTLLLAKGRYKLGFAGGRKSGAITHAIQAPDPPMHVGQLPVFQLRAAIGNTASAAYPTLDLGLTPAERQQGAAVLFALTASPAGIGGGKCVIGIFANATGVKFLGSAWWHRFMDVLEPHCEGYAIIEIVPMTGRSLLDSRYPAYYSSSIRKLSATLSGLSLFISADCGVMHLACASGTPTIGIFTITNPLEWGPYGPYDRAVAALDLTPEQVAQQVVA